jgi:hypothetical protein
MSRKRNELAAKTTGTGCKSSDHGNEVVDSLLRDVSPEELLQLDEATKRCEVDIRAIVKALDANTENHTAFMAEIAKLRASAEES